MITLSASQIKTFRLCKRKWALEKLAGLRGPETKAQALGKDVDDNQLQPFIRDGRPFDFTRESGYIAAAGAHWLPERTIPGLKVQKHFTFPSPSSDGLGIEFGYQGYMDLWVPKGPVPGFDDKYAGYPTVADFKTTKAKKWALTEDTLKEDVQAQLYAVQAILETRTQFVNLDWIYFLTDGTRKSFASQVTVHTEEVAKQFEAIEETARDLVQIRKKMPEGMDPKEYAMTLPCNRDACDMYGGCPFRHMCFADYLPAAMASATSSTREGNTKDERIVVMELDLLDILEARVKEEEDKGEPAAAVVEPSDVAAPAPGLGINPPMPEGTQLAPPVGDKPKKRGRPKKEVPIQILEETTPMPVIGQVLDMSGGKENVQLELDFSPAPAPAPVADLSASTGAPVSTVALPEVGSDDFDAAWAKLGAALKGFLSVCGAIAKGAS